MNSTTSCGAHSQQDPQRGDAAPCSGGIATVTDIPRTRSGKITELAVRDVIVGRPIANVEALANPEALEQFRDRPELA